MNHPLLPDVVLQSMATGIPLTWVGMERIAHPVQLQGQMLTAWVDAGVSLDAADAKGIHMSRLYLALETLSEGPLTVPRLQALLSAFLSSQAGLSRRAFVALHLQLPLKRPAMVSPLAGWRLYPLSLHAELHADDPLPQVRIALEIAYSSTCPCSAALSRQLIQQQFDQDFGDDLSFDAVRDWLGSSRGIVATPHSQRSKAHVSLTLDPGSELDLAGWIDCAEAALGTAVQTAVKRVDEQAFALANGQNLMFCEDAVRRLHQAFSARTNLAAFDLRVVHAESLHAHDAVAQSRWQRPSA